MAAGDSLITDKQAAALLGVSLRTVYRLQADGLLEPVYLQTTGRARLRRYRRAQVEARIQAAAQASA